MKFHTFVKTLHSVLGSLDDLLNNQPQHEFLASLLEIAAEGEIEVDSENAKNWLRADRRDHGYKRIFSCTKFSDAKFSTRLKAKTMNVWTSLQSQFEPICARYNQVVIDCHTNNHDKFIESLEWQLKIFLGLSFVSKCENSYQSVKNPLLDFSLRPVCTPSGGGMELTIDFFGNSFKRTKMLPDSETFSCAFFGFRESLMYVNLDNESAEFNPKITEKDYVAKVKIDKFANLRMNISAHIKQLWIICADLTQELTLINHFPELISSSTSQAVNYTYFTYSQEGSMQDVMLKEKYLAYGAVAQIIYLSKRPSDKNYFHIPKLGYNFYFFGDDVLDPIYGLGFHQLYNMNAYEAYQLHDSDVCRRVTVLNVIKNLRSIS